MKGVDPNEAEDNHKHQKAHAYHNDESRSTGDHGVPVGAGQAVSSHLRRRLVTPVQELL